MCDGFGKTPYTFFLLMCAALFIKHLRQLGFCRLLDPREQLSGQLIQCNRPRSEGGKGHDTFYLPELSKGLLTSGSMVRFPFHKGYYGKPTYHIGVSDLNGF